MIKKGLFFIKKCLNKKCCCLNYCLFDLFLVQLIQNIKKSINGDEGSNSNYFDCFFRMKPNLY